MMSSGKNQRFSVIITYWFCTENTAVVLAAFDNELVGVIGVGDPIKPDAANTITTLQKNGVRVIMITGDNRQVAETVAETVGISDVLSEMSPHDKSEEIRKLRQTGRPAPARPGSNPDRLPPV